MILTFLNSQKREALDEFKSEKKKFTFFFFFIIETFKTRAKKI